MFADLFDWLVLHIYNMFASLAGWGQGLADSFSGFANWFNPAK